MATLAEIRKAHPEYADLSDQELADGVYKKFYSDLPRAEFDAKLGVIPTPPPPQAWQAGTQRTPFIAPNVTSNRPLDIALEPITGYQGRLNEAFQSADAMAEHGAKTLARGDIAGLAGFLPGIAGVAAAPVSAALEPLSRPINDYVSPILEQTFGTPPEVSTPALTSLIPGLGVIKAPKAPALPSTTQTVQAKVKLPPAPSRQELRSAGGRAFKAADDAGVVYTAQGVERLRQNVLKDLEEHGFDEDLHPRVAAVLKRIDKVSDSNVTLRGMEIIRRVAGHAAESKSKSERRAAYKVINEISDFIQRPEDGDVLMGDAKRGAQAIADARDIWARLSKSELIDSVLDAAQRRAAKTGAGANIDNVIRQNIDRILGKDKKPRGFTADEIAAMENIVNGTPVRNALRLVGKLSPTGGLISIITGIGATASLPGGWLLPAGGFAAKVGADMLTRGAATKLSENIRRGQMRSRKTTVPGREPTGTARAYAPPALAPPPKRIEHQGP